jgi:putative membrane protein insertion efficiency factor
MISWSCGTSPTRMKHVAEGSSSLSAAPVGELSPGTDCVEGCEPFTGYAGTNSPVKVISSCWVDHPPGPVPGRNWNARSANSSRRWLTRGLQLPIRIYRHFVSPLLGPHCRFHPSCSTYALEALERHGPLRGGWLALGRLVRCGPWTPGGHDPVPPAKERA